MQAIFQTQNRALAITLATCGVPFAQGDDGHPYPFVHFYDRDILRTFRDANGKPLYQGMEVEQAARQAWRAGRQGMLVFNFQRNDLCERILKAYDRHSATIKAADDSGVPMPCEIDVLPETAAMICCQFTKNRNTFDAGWRKAVPYVAQHGAQRTESEGGKTVLIGSFKLTPLRP